MMKEIWLSVAGLIGAPLAAETIGNIEFQFPPSNYEWKLLVDQEFFFDYCRDNDDQGDEEILPEESLDCDDEDLEMRIFTHREGDALEVLIAINDSCIDDEEEDELDTLEIVQKQLDEMINQFLPNHKVIITNYSEHQDSMFVEWEIRDGSQELFHGLARGLREKKEGMQNFALISYHTTALKTEANQHIWTEALNQIKFTDSP
ncbi:MAG: hypothetical protein WCF19_02850 [Chlamydiales bacterium]